MNDGEAYQFGKAVLAEISLADFENAVASLPQMDRQVAWLVHQPFADYVMQVRAAKARIGRLMRRLRNSGASNATVRRSLRKAWPAIVGQIRMAEN